MLVIILFIRARACDNGFLDLPHIFVHAIKKKKCSNRFVINIQKIKNMHILKYIPSQSPIKGVEVERVHAHRPQNYKGQFLPQYVFLAA